MAESHSFSNNVLKLLVMIVMLALGSTTVKAQLVDGFYTGKCPHKPYLNVEEIITFAVESAFRRNRASLAGILRVHFHDCFVNGCDGSILIDSPSEKDAIPNLTLQGFEVVDVAKAAVEEACPGLVSCADILALAAQLAVRQLSQNRISWRVPTGRRDGNVSTAASTNGKLPPPTASVALLKSIFGGVGLNTEQMCTLSGAHSVGVAHCGAFQDRLVAPSNATLNPAYAAYLKKQCPGTNSNNIVNLDVTTPQTLDSVYFRNLQVDRGLLTSDENLQYDPTTKPIVAQNTDPFIFGPRFISAMIAMGNIDVKTGKAGNIRLNCRKFNA